MSDFTIIPYIAQSGTAWKRERELQYSAARAYSAKIAHQKRRRASSKKSGSSGSTTDPGDEQPKPQQVNVKRRKSLPDFGSACDLKPSDNQNTNPLPSLAQGKVLLESKGDEVLRVALKSLSLSRLAHETGCDETLSEANEYHMITLRHLRLALESPITAVREQTLAAILLTAHFDLLAGRGAEEVSTSLCRHYDGAIALLKIRGTTPVESEFEHHILHHLWMKLYVHCHATRRRFSQGLQDLYVDFASSTRFRDTSQSQLPSTFHWQLADFRASIADGTQTDAHQIIGEAQKRIQHVKTRWGMPDELSPREPSLAGLLQQQSQVADYLGNSHQILCKTGLFNSVSIIWMHDTILEQVERSANLDLWTANEVTELNAQSNRELESETLHVCTYAAQVLQAAKNADQLPRRHSTDARAVLSIANDPLTFEHSTDAFRRKIVNGNFEIPGVPIVGTLVWPLYTAGRASRVADTRQFCVRLLYQISHDYVVPLAARAAECVEAGLDIPEAGLAALGLA